MLTVVLQGILEVSAWFWGLMGGHVDQRRDGAL